MGHAAAQTLMAFVRKWGFMARHGHIIPSTEKEATSSRKGSKYSWDTQDHIFAPRIHSTVQTIFLSPIIINTPVYFFHPRLVEKENC